MTDPPSRDAESEGGGNSLIERLKTKIDQWHPVSQEQTFGSVNGVYCIEVETDRKNILATAKSYVLDEQASFSTRVCEKGERRDVLIAVFFEEPQFTLGNGYVYNPTHVLSQGAENINRGDVAGERDSAPSGQKVWLDIPLSDGVVFGDYIGDHADIVHKNNILEYVSD